MHIKCAPNIVWGLIGKFVEKFSTNISLMSLVADNFVA